MFMLKNQEKLFMMRSSMECVCLEWRFLTGFWQKPPLYNGVVPGQNLSRDNPPLSRDKFLPGKKNLTGQVDLGTSRLLGQVFCRDKSRHFFCWDKSSLDGTSRCKLFNFLDFPKIDFVYEMKNLFRI